MADRPRIATFQAWTSHLDAWLARRADDMVATLSVFSPLKIFDDPEAIFQEGWLFCDAGDYERGLEFLQRGVARGYAAAMPLKTAPQFDSIRGLRVSRRARRRRSETRERVAGAREAGGTACLRADDCGP